MRSINKYPGILLLCAVIVSLTALACAGEKADTAGSEPKPAGEDGRKVGIPETGKGEREAGLLESPVIPFDLETTYVYQVTSEEKEMAKAEITFTAVGDEGYRVDCTQYINDPEFGSVIAEIHAAYALDKNLGPKMYIQRMSDGNGSPRGTRTIDFTGSEIALETRMDPLDEGEGVVNFIDSAGDEVWAFDFQNMAGIVTIAACIDPSATKAGLWALMVNEDRIARLSFEYRGDEPIVLRSGNTTMMARAYEMRIDDMPLGWLYISPDGRLIAKKDTGSNLYAELEIADDQAPVTE